MQNIYTDLEVSPREQIETFLTYCRIESSIHDELASGTFLQDNADAFMMKSLTDNLMLSFDKISFNSLRNLKVKENTVCNSVTASTYSNSKQKQKYEF